jgi:hypothetical protein
MTWVIFDGTVREDSCEMLNSRHSFYVSHDLNAIKFERPERTRIWISGAHERNGDGEHKSANVARLTANANAHHVQPHECGVLNSECRPSQHKSMGAPEG